VRYLQHGWSVRAHLAAILVAVVTVFLAAGASLAHHTVHLAQRNTRQNASYLAGVAADAVAENLAVGSAQVVSTAANPALGAVLADPSGCQLAFELELFPGSRLDLVRPDGRIVCSSMAGIDATATQAGTAWFSELPAASGVITTGPFVDEATERASVLIGAPVIGVDGQRLGSMTMVIPTDGVADALAGSFGGPRHYDFSVVDEASRSMLSVSTAAAASDRATGENPLVGEGVLAGSQAIDGTSWRVFAGLSEGRALGPARSVRLRGVLLGAAVLAVLLASLAVVNRRIARPLQRLTGVLGDGPHAQHVLSSIRGPREIVRLAEALRAAMAAHESFQEQLSHQALHDPLTGLPNRALLAERLAHSLKQATASGETVAVLFLDVDRFKLVNDGLGHASGDHVLIGVAARLAEALRPGDTLARFGGDEFVIVADGFANGEEAEHLAERLLAGVAVPVDAGDTVVRVTASVGLALSTPTSTGGDLIREADTAMYLAKERGGARCERFDDDLRDQVTTRLTVENEFRVALERQQLRLVYQPKVDLASGLTVAVEALLRWDHPALGSVSPATFIPIAEETGLIVPVGRFVLEQACRQAAAWRDEGIDMSVAVNISGRQVADAALVDDVATVLRDTGLAPDRLCLELTESQMMYDTGRAARTLGRLHDLGVQLSIDDFGTGYSSLAYLHRFPVDELKIDRIFVQGLTDRPDERSLVTAMVAMATALGLHIVAEGVETAEQAELVRALGCHSAQGYFFSRPGPPDRIRSLLQPAPERTGS
jgi:diguanylate cyclase (GGDEF)-like protein